MERGTDTAPCSVPRGSQAFTHQMDCMTAVTEPTGRSTVLKCGGALFVTQLKIPYGSNCTGGGSPFLPHGAWGMWRQGPWCHTSPKPRREGEQPQFHSREVPALSSISNPRAIQPCPISWMPFQELLTTSILRGFCGLSSERNQTT